MTLFHEPDEPVADVLAVWEATAKHLTRRPDPWDQCLDVDPFTGQPDHIHGDACPGDCA